jgi:hypothetical protein
MSMIVVCLMLIPRQTFSNSLFCFNIQYLYQRNMSDFFLKVRCACQDYILFMKFFRT